jgi:DnaJ-class molecular chaperone
MSGASPASSAFSRARQSAPQQGQRGPSARSSGADPFASPPTRSKVFEKPLECSLEELYSGASKKVKVTIDGRSKVFSIQLTPGWKAGTKVKFHKSSAAFPFGITFVVKEKKHPIFDRQPNNDLIYRFPIPADGDDGNRSPLRDPILVEVPLLNGSTWSRYVHPRHVQHGKTIIIPDQGMPHRVSTPPPDYPNLPRKKATYGSLIIEFYDASQERHE